MRVETSSATGFNLGRTPSAFCRETSIPSDLSVVPTEIGGRRGYRRRRDASERERTHCWLTGVTDGVTAIDMAEDNWLRSDSQLHVTQAGTVNEVLFLEPHHHKKKKFV